MIRFWEWVLEWFKKKAPCCGEKKEPDATAKRSFFWIKVICIIALFAIVACTALNKKVGLKDDNPAEELVEAIIEAKTGLNIDLTPESPEK